MKRIPLTQGQIALVDDEDYDFLMQWKWFAMKLTHNFYAARRPFTNKKNGKFIFMHRLILGVTDSKILVDHKDRDSLNNQKENIRIATRYQNAANKSSHLNSSSKYLGVSWHKETKKWRSRISKNRKYVQLGMYSNEQDAALAYNNAAKLYHGDFASLNII